ncbi:hypothetical protein R1T16_07480 [Flavobacterium sp. DG1-102-2]|uniref:hypothetical protein n=1 Tax=Flavobacterium sp. DG1-102-2 TaxID=3081663 RepID=UPI00294A880F|nr:hypothetical protein [Flavobacterium sp. DG1-102-2]MDV6168262.1 hypothetical protein [Flavobacterium sp. DG1-102-2]
MSVIKNLFWVYIYGSMHVALSVLALVLMTNHIFQLPFNWAIAVFACCGTMFSYNFMKYDGLFRVKKTAGKKVRFVVFLSTLALIAAGISFLFLERVTQITALAFFALTALYTVPFFPNTKNLRNWSGIKIYIVALCWAGITLVVPLIDAHIALASDVYLKFGQRFFLVILLILIFEIIDLKEDDPHLKTIPQQIGVRNTKILILCCLLPFFLLEFLRTTLDYRQIIGNLIMVVTVSLFTIFANPKRSKYYTLFWVESIPVFWLGVVVLVSSL